MGALLAAGLAIALVYGFVTRYLPLRAQVDIGAGSLAKQMCSCLYVAERSVEACRADQSSLLDPIGFELRSDEQLVWAGIPMLGARTALYREGFGCTLE
jgi:hypothetical protein